MSLNILDEGDMKKLRAGYDRGVLLGLAKKMVDYEKEAKLVDWIANTVFNAGTAGYDGPRSSLTNWERELAIICVVGVQRDTFVLSGHLYWALMEWEPAKGEKAPLTRAIEKLADLLMTLETYTGVNNFRLSSRVFEEVLGALKELAVKTVPPATAVSTQEVLMKFKTIFPPR